MTTMKDVFESALISELRLPTAITVESGTSLREVAELLCSRHFGCVPVVKENKLIGIFTERDWLNRVLRKKVSLDQPVDDVMTANPISLDTFGSLWQAAKIMGDKGIRHVPVVDSEGCPKAMISVRDILQYLAECFPEQFLAHPPNNKTITLQTESG